MSDLAVWRTKGYGILRCTCSRCAPPRTSADCSVNEASVDAAKSEPQHATTSQLLPAPAPSAQIMNPPAVTALAADTSEITHRYNDGPQLTLPNQEATTTKRTRMRKVKVPNQLQELACELNLDLADEVNFTSDPEELIAWMKHQNQEQRTEENEHRDDIDRQLDDLEVAMLETPL